MKKLLFTLCATILGAVVAALLIHLWERTND